MDDSDQRKVDKMLAMTPKEHLQEAAAMLAETNVMSPRAHHDDNVQAARANAHLLMAITKQLADLLEK